MNNQLIVKLLKQFQRKEISKHPYSILSMKYWGSNIFLKTLLTSVDSKTLLLIAIIYLELNDNESIDETITRVKNNIRIGVIVTFSNQLNKILCRKCNGGKKLFCDCDTGNIKCPDCKYTGDRSCRRCKGSREVECPECYGTTFIPCENCEGEGYVKSESYCNYEISSLVFISSTNKNKFEDALQNKKPIENLLSKENTQELVNGFFEDRNYDDGDEICAMIDKKYCGNKYLLTINDLYDDDLIIKNNILNRLFLVTFKDIYKVSDMIENLFT